MFKKNVFAINFNDTKNYNKYISLFFQESCRVISLKLDYDFHRDPKKRKLSNLIALKSHLFTNQIKKNAIFDDIFRLRKRSYAVKKRIPEPLGKKLLF